MMQVTTIFCKIPVIKTVLGIPSKLIFLWKLFCVSLLCNNIKLIELLIYSLNDQLKYLKTDEIRK